MENINLKFKRAKGKPKVGQYVALHNCFPMEQMGNIGLIVEIKKDGLGFNYGVFEFYDKKIYHHHISTIIPLTVRWNFELNLNR